MLLVESNFTNYVLNSRWKTELKALSKPEIAMFSTLILSVILLVAFDLQADFISDQSFVHIALDFFFGSGASAGVFLIWLHMGKARRAHVSKIAQAEDSAAHWKFEAEAIQKGIADEIERQLADWLLTPSEKEVAFLLLKGLSLKEISTVRGTAERTVRHHTLAIYEKAGVTGRAELSAFFLEEFLDRQGSVAVLSPRIKNHINKR